MRRIVLALAVLLSGLILVTPQAQAHVERPSYWPDPKPDCTVRPCAGGAVPTARTLKSALNKKLVGNTRVVCKQDSMKRVRASISKARKRGYYIRPTDHRSFSKAEARRLLTINQKLMKRCRFHEIQPAVTASHNNDRVVVMPGLYTEPTAAKKPTHDKSCIAKYATKADSGDPGALSHDYQLHCPNDANLVAVIGRGADTAPLPATPHEDRHGIPNVGSCIRCNLQLEGSGVSADDVIVEAGDPKAGNGGPSAVGHRKDVGIFVDRADGFVLRNVTVRHAREHAIYVMETDGYLLDRFKTYYAGGYGVLTFVEDHGVMQNCEAMGSGDSGLYPGSGADSTDKRYEKFYPKARFSQVVRLCDSHHNAGGFSGTNSHGTLIEHNNFYDNALGYTTDVFTAPGHPGFPQHGNTIRNNNFYSNNFNPYVAGSDVQPFIASPVGTGLWLAGGNANTLEGNRFYDNWRRGVMLYAVPDATVCGPILGSTTPVPGCSTTGISTSYDNKFHHNIMGEAPDGSKKPNGTDFWWDSFVGNTGNCWWSNRGPGGAAVTSAPPVLPDCAGGTNPALSVGLLDVGNELELVACLAGFQLAGYPNGDSNTCSWTVTPSKPGTGSPTALAAAAGPSRSDQLSMFADICAAGFSPKLCAPFAGVLTSQVARQAATATAEKWASAAITAAQTPGALSSFTCSWWRKADASHRLGMVQRIRNFATGPINGSPGDSAYGYGAGMTDARATELFNDRCSFFGAGPFGLYKIYGAAAPFAALAN